MATFYIQLENKLLQISGELTAENISKCLGYVPVSPNVTNDLSQRVDNISFDNLKDNPFLQDGSGELNIVDEAGNVVAKVDSEGIHSVDFIAGEHKLTDKIDSTALNGYAKESWVSAEIAKAATEGKIDLTGYATEEWVEGKNYLTEHQDISHLATKQELSDLDFYSIKDNPIINEGNGQLIFVDESGYIGLQLEEDGLHVKDVVADGHVLSEKANASELSNYATKDEVSSLVDMSVVEELQGKVSVLVGEDADKSVREIANDELAKQLLEGNDNFQTLQELSAWIDEHPDSAATMNEAIQKNAEDITKSLTSAKSYTDEKVSNIDFYNIKDNPMVDGEAGTITFVDETGYIGLKVTEDGIITKDVVTPEHILSEKANKSFVEDNYYNKSTVDKKITEAVTGGQVSLDGFATEQWVNEQGFLKTHQDISHLAEKSELPTKTSDLTNDSGFITLADVPVQEIPEEYVTETELSQKGYLTEHQDISHLAEKSELPTKTSDLTNDSGFITLADVPVQEIPEEYVTETELSQKGYLTEHQDISHLASRTWVESQEYAHQEDLLNISFNDIQGSPITIDESGELNFVDESGNVGFKVNEEGLYVKDVVAGDHKLSEKANSIDIPTHTSQLINNSGYITKTVVDQEIAKLVDGAPETLNTLNELASAMKDNSDVVDVLNQSISSKQDTITDLESIREGAELGKTALQEVPEGYAKTEDIPSVEGLASEQWVNNKNFVQRTDLLNMSFNDIQGSPITEDESGELNFVDESSNIGLKINNEGIYVKDVIAGEHVLSQKQDALVDGETIKTINGQSILGEGNIEIGIGGSGKIYEGSISNNITLVPNHMYVRNYSFGRLIINGFETTKGESGNDTLSDEYWIMLRCGFEEIDPGITWPDEYYDIQWMDGVEPEIEIDKSYIFHITRYRHPVNWDQNIYLVDYKVFKKKTNINESDSEISNEVTFPIYIDLNESPTTNDLNDRMALYNYLMEKYDLKNARINGPTDLDPSDDININGVLGPEYSKIKEVLHDGYDLIALRGKVNEFDYYQLSSTGDISVYID